jgi:6,7-dimethyl-8-ribityllumazine synthase
MRTIEGSQSGAGFRFAVVVSKYHDFITARLQTGALAALKAAGVSDESITIVKVPGAFEIPQAAVRAGESGRYDAVVSLGCLIKGETPHFDFIAAAVAHGLMDAAGATGVPMAFGVLTTNTLEEAVARTADGPANKGWEAAAAAVEMAAVFAGLTDRSPA